MANISQITLPDNTTYDLADATLRSKIKVVATVAWDTSTSTGTISKSYSELYSAVHSLNSTLPAIDYYEYGGAIFAVPTHYYLFLYSNDSDSSVLTFKTPGNGYGYEIRIARSIVPRDPGYEDKIYRTQLKPTASWGNVSGTLANQTDLQNALNAKQGTLTAGTNITIENNVISATGSSLEGITIIIPSSGWSSDTITFNNVEYHRYVTPGLESIPENPVIGIGVPSNQNVPTKQQQEAYDTWNYAIKASGGAGDVLWLLSETIPESDFYIFIQGAIE